MIHGMTRAGFQAIANQRVQVSVQYRSQASEGQELSEQTLLVGGSVDGRMPLASTGRDVADARAPHEWQLQAVGCSVM